MFFLLVKVTNFNKQKPPPDVQKEEWITCANPESMNPNEIGYKQLGDKVVDLLEKQVGLFNVSDSERKYLCYLLDFVIGLQT